MLLTLLSGGAHTLVLTPVGAPFLLIMTTASPGPTYPSSETYPSASTFPSNVSVLILTPAPRG